MNTRHLIAALALTTAATANAEPKNLLFYGNSFTGSGGGVHLLVRDIATGAGEETPHVFGRVVGGQTLQFHLDTGTSVITSGIMPGENWDAVVLQEYSTRPTTHPSDGNVPGFLSAAQGLYQAVQSHSPDAQAVLFETWARGPGNSVYPGIWSEPAEMQAELRDNYNLANSVLNGIGTSEVAPVGDAFENAGFNLDLYAGDIYHASNKGALVISLVIYGTIYDDTTLTDIDLSAVSSRLGLSTADVNDAIIHAESVLIPAPVSGTIMLGLGCLAMRRRRA